MATLLTNAVLLAGCFLNLIMFILVIGNGLLVIALSQEIESQEIRFFGKIGFLKI
jgi:hypothetical protein